MIFPNQEGCKLCSYYVSDVCGECQEDGKFPWFEARRDLQVEDLPRFPLKEFNNGMPPKMRQIVLGVYMDLVVRKLQE